MVVQELMAKNRWLAITVETNLVIISNVLAGNHPLLQDI